MSNLTKKVKIYLIHRLQEQLSNFYKFRHPSKYTLNFINKFRVIFRMMYPNDRWNLEIFADEWINYSQKFLMWYS